MPNTSASMTYDSLRADVEEYSERHDAPFTTQIPRFIMLAENRIASEVRGLGLLKIVCSKMTGPVLSKPTRWRETSSMNCTVGTKRIVLYERGYEYCRVFAPDAAKTGTPRFYADYGYEHWLVVPTPAAVYKFEALYYERPEPLSEINQTSWTTQYAPQLLLYGALLEAQPFLKLDGRIETYQNFYNAAAIAVTNEAKRRAFDRSSGMRE